MKRTRIRQFALLTLTVAAVCFAVVIFRNRISPEQHAAELLRQARRHSARGDVTQAEDLARQALIFNNNLPQAHLIAAECAISRKEYELALSDLSRIPTDDAEQWLRSRQLAADLLHNRVYRFREAEEAYKDLLHVQPDNVFANDGYARLLGLCGRRSEAIPHILMIIKSGMRTDLLMLLSRESAAINDSELLESAHRADPSDPNPLLGQAADAESRQDYQAALQKLQQAATLDRLPSAFSAQMAKILLATERYDELAVWRSEFEERDASADSWLVLATLSDRANDPRGAIRCYWEAIKQCPESLPAMNQIAQRLTAANCPELAVRFRERVEQINNLRDAQQIAIMSDGQPAFQQMYSMVQAYHSVGRLWEAYAWGKIANDLAPNHPELSQILVSIKIRLDSLPLQMTVPESNPALQVDLSHFAIPNTNADPQTDATVSVSNDIAFRKQGQDIGFYFQYFNGSDTPTKRMFELGGGGLAAIDIDHDDAVDLFCTQGKRWPPEPSKINEHHDKLFRNERGQRFNDASEPAGIDIEIGFGQGAAAGDVNNDGFTDLYVANTGQNTLWLNNGDGTFSDGTARLANRQSKWTTSCLIADLNGDSVPDLYDVNYLSGDDVFERVCLEEHGNKVQCLPYDFEAATDCIWLGQDEGQFHDETDTFLNPAPKGKGLGAVAFNTGNQQVSLFIANDTTANFFYTALDSADGTLTDTAVTIGLAFNGDGKAEAGMGIAVADCNQDERFDLLVTNFLYESNTIYSPDANQFYEDKTRQMGLHEPTLSVLGWGTQFLDANLDGRLELFVSNGYTQDLTSLGIPFQMRPHMYEWTGRRFTQLPAESLGTWSTQKVAGRAAARIDWNMDGKPDLAVGLLDQPSYVLTNESNTPNNSYIMRLGAVKTSRDAIGTIVKATVGESNYVHQLTAGDGYQCSNEHRITIGCGSSKFIDRIEVVWPSGGTQTFLNVKAPGSAILLEGRELLDVP